MPPPETCCRADAFTSLQSLATRWLGECEQLTLTLAVRQGELEQCQRLAAHAGANGLPVDPFLRRLIAGLEASCDHLADELAHVRLALLAVTEELASTRSTRSASPHPAAA